MIDLDRRESQALKSRRRARLADEPRQVVAGRAVAVEAGVGLYAPDCADVTGDEVGRLLAPACDHDDVLGQAGERVRGEIRTATGDVHPAVRARGTSRLLPRLREGLVRDAA